MTEPKWLPKSLILRVHGLQITEHGGLAGIRDEGLLDSALMRPVNAFSFESADLFQIASLYAAGIIGNHPFLDGNKRTGYIACLTFLMANGFRLTVAMEERLAKTLLLSGGELTDTQFADWLREATEPLAPS